MLGIDKDIKIITDAYSNHLWPDSSYFGRVFPNEKKDGVIPEVAIGNHNYKEVLLNDRKACTSFFYVLPDRGNPATVWIHFAVNLNKIYTGLDRETASEKALLDARSVTHTAGFTVNDFVTGAEAYDTWTYISQNRMDMQPFFLFRLEIEMWQEFACDESERTTYNLNISAETGGTVEPYEGSQPKPINSTQAINAVASSGYTFKEWLINGISDINRLTTVLMDKTINAVAYFDFILEPYYQFLKLGNADDLTDYGTGQNDAVYVSGSMAGQDLIIRQQPDQMLIDLSEKYGLYWTNGSGSMIDIPYSVLKGYNGYPFHLNQKQLLFLGEGNDITNNEVIDHSGNSNATLWSPAITCDAPKTSSARFQVDFVNTPIEIDLRIDGNYIEFIYEINANVTGAVLLSRVGSAGLGVIIRHTNLELWSFDTGNKLMNFTNITSTDGELKRYRLISNGTDVTCQKTSVSDESFESVDIEQAITITPTNLTTLIVDHAFRGGYAGTTCYIDLNGIVFPFTENRRVAGGGNTTRFHSTTSSHTISTLPEEYYFTWQNEFHWAKMHGITEMYANELTTGGGGLHWLLNIGNKPDGTSNLESFANIYPRKTGVYLTAAECVNKLYPNIFGISLDASNIAYDVNNTFFDGSNNPKVLSAASLPYNLDNKIFFDHKNGLNVLLYDTAITSEFSSGIGINTNGEEYFKMGDSISATLWFDFFNYKNSALNYGVAPLLGARISIDYQPAVEAALISDPTLLSRAPFIIVNGGTNDADANVDLTAFRNGLISLLDLFRAENPTCPIIFCSILDVVESVDPARRANHQLYFDVEEEVAALYTNMFFVDWFNLGLTTTDISDGTHPYNAPACKKLLDRLMETVNNSNTLKIPELEFSINNQNDEILDMKTLQQ